MFQLSKTLFGPFVTGFLSLTCCLLLTISFRFRNWRFLIRLGFFTVLPVSDFTLVLWVILLGIQGLSS